MWLLALFRVSGVLILDAVAGTCLLVLLLDVWQLMITVKQESTEHWVFSILLASKTRLSQSSFADAELPICVGGEGGCIVLSALLKLNRLYAFLSLALLAVIAGVQPGRDLWRDKRTTRHISFDTWGLSPSPSRWFWATSIRTTALLWRVSSTRRKSTIRNAGLPRIPRWRCAWPAPTTAWSAAYELSRTTASNLSRAAAHAKLSTRPSCESFYARLPRNYRAYGLSCNSKSIQGLCFEM